MLSLIITIFVLAIFGKIALLLLKGAWGLTKIFFTLFFLPLILIGLVLKGLAVIALPALIVFGVVALLSSSIIK